jgi:small subunit ribosomal protein S16
VCLKKENILATKIRLKRFGKKRAPFYRVVVIDSRKARNGKAIEEIGLYHPTREPSVIEINSERAQYWLSVGAQPSDTVTSLLKLTGDWATFKGEKGVNTVKPQPAKLSPEEKIKAAADAAEKLKQAAAIKAEEAKKAEAEAAAAEAKAAAEAAAAEAAAEVVEEVAEAVAEEIVEEAVAEAVAEAVVEEAVAEAVEEVVAEAAEEAAAEEA